MLVNHKFQSFLTFEMYLLALVSHINTIKCIHGWGTTIETMTTLSCVLNSKTRTQQNECSEMLNSERGICMFKFSINKCYNECYK
jgi:hypothetical protein